MIDVAGLSGDDFPTPRRRVLAQLVVEDLQSTRSDSLTNRLDVPDPAFLVALREGPGRAPLAGWAGGRNPMTVAEPVTGADRSTRRTPFHARRVGAPTPRGRRPRLETSQESSITREIPTRGFRGRSPPTRTPRGRSTRRGGRKPRTPEPTGCSTQFRSRAVAAQRAELSNDRSNPGRRRSRTNAEGSLVARTIEA